MSLVAVGRQSDLKEVDTDPPNVRRRRIQDAVRGIFDALPAQLMQSYGQPARQAMMMQTDIYTSAQSTSRFGSNEQVPHRHDIRFL